MHDMTSLTQQQQTDIVFMRKALEQATIASERSEVPVGAVVVQGDKIIGKAFNQTIASCDPSAHAEVLALRDAAKRVANHRLPGSTVYVTLEPCLMCCGCLQHARVDRVVFGAREPRTGAVVSVNEVLADPNALHRIAVTEGILADECVNLLKQFFRHRRD